MRKLLVGILGVAMLAAWLSSDRNAPAASTTSATPQRSSSDNGDKVACTCFVVGFSIRCIPPGCTL